MLVEKYMEHGALFKGFVGDMTKVLLDALQRNAQNIMGVS